MGSVYRGEDSKLGRAVALKVLSAHYATDRMAKDRFLREARLSASINHPNVITVHAVGERPAACHFGKISCVARRCRICATRRARHSYG